MRYLFLIFFMVSCSSSVIVQEIESEKSDQFLFDHELILRLVGHNEEIKIKNKKIVFQGREEEIISSESLPYKSFRNYCKKELSIGVVLETVYRTQDDKYLVSQWMGVCGERELSCATLNGKKYSAYTNLSTADCPL